MMYVLSASIGHEWSVTSSGALRYMVHIAHGDDDLTVIISDQHMQHMLETSCGIKRQHPLQQELDFRKCVLKIVK